MPALICAEVSGPSMSNYLLFYKICSFNFSFASCEKSIRLSLLDLCCNMDDLGAGQCDDAHHSLGL